MDDQLLSLEELDDLISNIQKILLLIPRSHPLRPFCIQNLGAMQFMRYTLSSRQGDLEQSILCFTEAIFLPSTWNILSSNIAEIFCSVATTLFVRTKESRRPEDIKYCIMYLRYLRGHGASNLSPFSITSMLVRALVIRVELELRESRDAVRDIEEMADLCDELLNSDISITPSTDAISAFVGAVDFRFRGSMEGQHPSRKVIECLRKANVCLPDSHGVSIVLVRSLFSRYEAIPLDEDYKEAMAILDKILNFRGPGGMPSPYWEVALMFAARLSETRFNAHGKPEHLEQAIYRLRSWLVEASLEDPVRLVYTEQLSRLEAFRLADPNVLANTNTLRLLTSNPGTSRHPSFRDLTASIAELKDAESMSVTTTFMKHHYALRALFMEPLTLSDIEDGLGYCQQLLVSYPDSPMYPSFRLALASVLFRAFLCTSEIEYLNKAISVCRDNANTIDSLSLRRHSLKWLVTFLTARLSRLYCGEDLDELMQLFPIAAQHEQAGSLHQLPVSRQWASIARCFGHSSTPTAYERAISFMQSSLTFAPTLDAQHSRQVGMRREFETLTSDYASYYIQTGGLKQAIEVIEKGRTLLWSEMRRFRTSIDRIRFADSHLADKFVAVNKDLEMLSLSFSSNNTFDGRDSDVGGMDPYGHLVARQQRLSDDREMLITRIRALPGLDTFLKSPSFDTLHCAALHGPVIIINHSVWRSDIVILLHNSPPSLIPTPNDFYARASKLQDQLPEERKKGLESDTYEDTLRSVLKQLYELVGHPVLKRLKELNIPEQSRVWWCPTSAFCSLPLHAMGPIPSDVGPPKYFLDIYIPSYIPSLSALIESRKPCSQAIGKPSILLVAQPDEKMPEALKEMNAVRAANTRVTTLFSAKATPTAVLERLRDHPFAHIVCHGILEPGKPFEASFKLHSRKRLQLLDIVRSQLPDAEFAFLSACHTAEQTDESIADEVLHLAAAMQFCGFRSVVGTMWAMADTDGRDLARDFYRSVFSESDDGRQGTRYYERTAKALRDAVKNLRRKGGVTLERWVNFVHYGA